MTSQSNIPIFGENIYKLYLRKVLQEIRNLVLTQYVDVFFIFLGKHLDSGGYTAKS